MSYDWHYLKDGRRFGPCTLKQLQQLADANMLAPNDLVSSGTADAWKPAGGAPGLSFKTASKSPPPSDLRETTSGRTEDVNAKSFPRFLRLKATFRAMIAYFVEFRETIRASVILLSLLGLWFVWQFGFSTTLQCLACIMSTAAAGLGLIALSRRESRYRTPFGAAAAICACSAWVCFAWAERRQLYIPTFDAFADAREITEAYQTFVVHVQTRYLEKHWVLIFPSEAESGCSGSGVVIANDRNAAVILTNRHVIDPVFSGHAASYRDLAIQVKLASENEWRPAAIAAIHRNLDLALLVWDRQFPRKRAVRFVDRGAIRQGEEVVALGNPLGLEFVTTGGNVSKLDGAMIVTDCPINPGNSGGPLFLKREGLLAGINTAGFVDAQNLNLAICADQALSAGVAARNTTQWQWLISRDDVEGLMKLIPVER